MSEIKNLTNIINNSRLSREEHEFLLNIINKLEAEGDILIRKSKVYDIIAGTLASM